MASCCESADQTPSLSKAGQSKVFTVALAGNPNSGKTTIFNALTGLRQKVANYPGVTVEKKTGRCPLPDGAIAHIIDLPGTYSLISRSPDEQVAMEVLRGLRSDTPPPDAVVVVVDASNLQRNLYLVSQLIEVGHPLVVALNMMDIAQRRGIEISPERLETQLGVPVIPLVGYKRVGIDALKAAILRAAVAPIPNWPLPTAMREELTIVGGGLSILTPDLPVHRGRVLAERLLIGDRAADLTRMYNQEPVNSLLAHAGKRLTAAGVDPIQADIEAHYHWIDGVAAASLIPACERLMSPLQPFGSAGPSPARQPTLTQKIDRVLVHKIWGLMIFALVMATLFVTIFWLAQPIMDATQNGILALGHWLTNSLPGGPLKSMLNDGIFSGVGTVLAFVPQIALLFMFLAILEDTGYLARAAFLMDRLLARVGLHGKSFIPLLSSFACAIPGIMATRTIENRRDRLATILIAPFMSCSARLPVYALLIGTLFSHYGAFVQAGIMLACYSLGILAAVGTAWVFKKSLLKGGATTFILELPSYKLPQISQVARQVWLNAGKFVTKAGTTILAFSIVLWALSYYPRLPAERAAQVRTAAIQQAATSAIAQPVPMTNSQSADIVENAVAGARREYSLAGRMGHAMEPALKPLGFDWKMGVGLVGAFAARETFISTMAVTYSVGNVESGTNNLSAAMRADKYPDGKPVWTPLVAISLLVWFVLALQCISTVAITRRETGGWRWPIFMILYMNVLAYVASLVVYQAGVHLLRV
ncbi:MAG: ferrous iron transport protein B [Planctomycetota bacterium]|nr:ferrous iron transport protein B [Planctomycetota bacterium]